MAGELEKSNRPDLFLFEWDNTNQIRGPRMVTFESVQQRHAQQRVKSCNERRSVVRVRHMRRKDFFDCRRHPGRASAMLRYSNSPTTAFE
jgi:hypothetical protein